MRSKLIAVFVLFLLSSCGLFGQKEDALKVIGTGVDITGCLDSIGPKIEKYVAGDIEKDSWEEAWDCTIEAVNTFNTFVAGSDSEGFEVEDIHKLLGTVLITDKQVSKPFVRYTFHLKAALFGGSSNLIKHSELKNAIDIFQVAKTESTRLIPHFKNKAYNPTAPNLIAFSEAFELAFRNLGIALNSKNHKSFPVDKARAFEKELAVMLGWENAPRYVDAIMAAKILMLGGREEKFLGSDWPRIFGLVGALGGPALAGTATQGTKDEFLKGPNAFWEFIFGLTKPLKKYFDEAIEVHEGKLDYTLFTSLFDKLPVDTLSQGFKDAVNQVFPTVFDKLFEVKTPGGFNQEAFDALYNTLKTWVVSQTHLETIFQNFDLEKNGVEEGVFISAATQYLRQLSSNEDRTSINSLMRVCEDHPPIFKTADWQATWQPGAKHSLHNITVFGLIDMALQRIIKAYSEDGINLTNQEFNKFWSDVEKLLIHLKYIDPTISGLGDMRFLQADILTLSGDGNGFFNLREGVDLVAILLSAAEVTEAVTNKIQDPCKLASNAKDSRDFFIMEPSCFRNEFFDGVAQYWDHLPLLLDFWNGLGGSDRSDFRLYYEDAARSAELSQNLTAYDAENFAGIGHFLEALFYRYDTDTSGTLDTEEIMKVFPTFRKLILEQVEAMDDQIIDLTTEKGLKSIFTYLIHYGKRPDQDFGSTLQFLLWYAKYPKWTMSADRLDVYKVVPMFDLN